MPLSSLNTDSFDLASAIFLAEASQAAYPDHLPVWSSSLESKALFNRGNIQGYWVADGEVALLAFRGTDNLRQWLRDARIAPTTHAWGRVHVGFHTGLAEVELDMPAFDAVAAKAKHVWITGHSLGGALAVLAAARLKMKGIDSRVYTFGQPAMGAFDFAERFDAELPGRLIRFINQSDIVARLPPALPFLNYEHCGHVKRIVRPGVLEARRNSEASNPPPEIDETPPPPATEAEEASLLAALDANPDLFDETSLRPEGRLMPSFFKDHYMTEYIRLLKEMPRP
jgi:triacylglycerol lipase